MEESFFQAAMEACRCYRPDYTGRPGNSMAVLLAEDSTAKGRHAKRNRITRDVTPPAE